MMIITPYDKSVINDIERAIRDSDLGVNPATDRMIVRVVMPQLTEERQRGTSRPPRPRPKRRGSPSATSDGTPTRCSTRWPRTGRRRDDVKRAEKHLDDAARSTSPASTTCSKHKESRTARGLTWPTRRPLRNPEAAQSKAGRNLPVAIAAGVVLGGLCIAPWPGRNGCSSRWPWSPCGSGITGDRQRFCDPASASARGRYW